MHRNITKIISLCGIMCVVLILLVLNGCAWRPAVPYDNAEKILLGTAIGGQIFDYTSTRRALNMGCIEGNPLMSSDAVMIASKIGISAMSYYGANSIIDHRMRKIYLGLIGAIGIGAGVHNEMIDCSPGN